MSQNQMLLEIIIGSRRTELPAVRDRVRDLACAEGFADDGAAQIVLAVDEALANVIEHGYQGDENKPIEIRFSRIQTGRRRGLRVSVRDYGRQVDPASIRSRDLSDIRPGGLGVHIMRCLMDDVNYACAAGCGMLLTMTKWISEPAMSTAQHGD